MAEITKNFTVNVPDELWVDSWESANTETYTYVGPDTLYLVYDTVKDVLTNSAQGLDVEPTDLRENEVVVQIDADVNPEVALCLLPIDENFQHEFEEQTNTLDNSTWQKITNPHIKDWFEVKVSDTTVLPVTLELDPIYKDLDTTAEEKARTRLAYVKKYSDAYDFGTEDQALIDTFITNMQTYLDTYAPVCPWKFAEGVPEGDMPRIPVSLVSVFNSLPEIE